MMEDCYFKLFNKCFAKVDTELSSAGSKRIKSIIKASQERGDDLPTDLECAIATDPQHKILCHRDCVSTYCSRQKIQKFIKSKGQLVTEPPPSKRTRRSSSEHEFSFQTQCIFCGNDCNEIKDPKNPGRWRPVSRCRTVNVGEESMKEAILRVCSERKDKWAQQVELRVRGALSDLHAADARYHNDCKPAFMAPKSVENAQISKKPIDKDIAFNTIIDLMEAGKTQIWSSVELYKLYTEKKGTHLQRRTLVEEVSNYFGTHILVLSCKGLANILVFRSRASQLVHLVEETDVDCGTIKSMAKQIVHESKALAQDTSSYSTKIDKAVAHNQCSETLLSLLSHISSKLDNSLAAYLIGNIITSAISHKSTTLQTALGVTVREKYLINILHDFCVTCTYDEVLRFKSSAARQALKASTSHGLFDAKNGLIQIVIDNYDANISSMNGLKSTHALAILVCQSTPSSNSPVSEDEYQIPRISKSEMNQPIDVSVSIQQYHGPKHPDMPELPPVPANKHDCLLNHQEVSLERARELDVEFLKSFISNDNACEYGGYLTRVARIQNHTIRPATAARYRPLLDLKPSDPSTVKTAMIEAQHLSINCGQQFVVITADQQIYKVIVDNIWATPEIFSNIYPRLGGLHTIMSFCGCVGKLMMDSGLSEILKHAFGGVEKMLSGKKYPQNVRAFRLVTEELLRKHITNVNTFEELDAMLTSVAKRSDTAKLWVECFVRPCLIMMIFVRAERESDWPLHLWAVSQMLPYFFASSHINYARYGLYYLRSMESLPGEVMQMFVQGQHTMRHVSGASNSTWSDMFIESTFMRYGHSQGGLTGITLNDNATKRWALSLHICSQLIRDITNMRDHMAEHPSHHKEESKARIQSDLSDRKKIQEKLEHCIDPLVPAGHSPTLFNIVSGKLADESVNVQNAVQIGRDCMQAYEDKLPQGFHDKLSSPVKTMGATRKQVKLGITTTFDTEVIFNRTLGIMGSGEVDLKDLFSHELAPIPTSLFLDDGNMRPASSKSKLKNFLEVQQSSRIMRNPDLIVLDGCAVLWTIHWPISGTLLELVNAVAIYIDVRLKNNDVYLIFDRYFDYSPKGCTRGRRTSISSDHRLLTLQSPLPPQSVSLTVTDNKVQIIDIICKGLLIHFQEHPCDNRLLITGSDTVPNEVHMGVHIKRHDLVNKHEEADVIIVNQVVSASREGKNNIHVVCDDTDVFVLLLHFYKMLNLDNELLMVPTSSKRNVSNIGDTVRKYENIVQNILPLHALTGCDTVSSIYGVGKVKAIKTLLKGYAPPPLGNSGVNMETILKGATEFITACYGSKCNGTMSHVRFNVWQYKTGHSQSKSFKLPSLPPTSEAFALHVKRAHHQACIWRAALESDPPAINPADYGWKADKSTKTLLPIALPAQTLPAPTAVMSLICCACSTDEPCSNRRCSCHRSGIPCSIFCKCCITPTANCNNPIQINNSETSKEDSDDEDGGENAEDKDDQ